MRATVAAAIWGNATLDILERDDTFAHINRYTEDFRLLIDDLLADSPFSGTSLGDGPLVDYVLTDASTVTQWETIVESDSETKKAIDVTLLEKGLLQHVGGKRYISTEYSDEELETTEEAYKRAIERVSWISS